MELEGLVYEPDVPQTAYEVPAKPDQRNADTLLFAACRRGDLAAVEVLLAHGLSAEDINAPRPGDGLTALACACWSGHVAIVSMLLKDSRTISSLETAAGETGLQIAQAAGRTDIVDLFLEADGLAWADAFMEAEHKRLDGLTKDSSTAKHSSVRADKHSDTSSTGYTAGQATCSECHQNVDLTQFSAAQKKKKAKRRCKTCITTNNNVGAEITQ
jgi:hypothetical protein